jgi:hypothetical protein
VLAIRDANAKRWSRPGERGRASEAKRAWWENLTPAQRAEWSRKVSERRKGVATVRACGCPNRAHYRDCPTREQVPA